MDRVALTDEQRQELRQCTCQARIAFSTRDRRERVQLSDTSYHVSAIARPLGQHEQTIRGWNKASLNERFRARPNSHKQALRRNWPIALLAFVSVIPLFVVRFLPVYDYPHWVYQAHVISHYTDFSRWYDLNWTPVPNLGSTLPLLFFGPLLGAELGTKVLVALYACAMVVAFAYFTRGIAPIPTATELFGPVLVYNYFFYSGFLSYTVGLPILLTTLGLLIRSPSRPTWRTLTVLTCLSLGAYLCHLFIWLPICFYICIVVLVTRTHKPTLLLSQGAPLCLLLIYLFQKGQDGGIPIQYYASISRKIFSLIAPNLPFQRVDPFPSPIPILATNIVVLGLVGGYLLICCQRRSRPQHACALHYMGGGLLAIAVLLPFTWISGMGEADRRLAFMASIVLLPQFGIAARRTLYRWFAALVSLFVLLLHTMNFVAADSQLRVVHDAIQLRPPTASVFVAALRHTPVHGECTPHLRNAGTGIFTLQWFPLYDAVERGGVAAHTFSTASIHTKPDLSYPMLFSQFQTEQERSRLVVMAHDIGNVYDYLFLLGCPEDIQSVSAIWQSNLKLVGRGTYYAIIRLNNSNTRGSASQTGGAPGQDDHAIRTSN